MAESVRSLLQREFDELLAGARERWSARAVVRAARALRQAWDGDAEEDRCRLLVLTLGIDPDGEGLWHSSEEIRALESRAWLLSIAGPAAARSRSR